MKKKYLLWIGALLAAIMLVGAVIYIIPAKPQIVETYSRSLHEQDVTVTRTKQELTNGEISIERRRYQLENGDQIIQGRVWNDDKEREWREIESWNLKAENGAIWYYDTQEQVWKESALEEQQLNSTCIYVDTDGVDLFLYVPQGYKLLERQSLQATGSRGYITVKEKRGGFHIDLHSSYLNTNDVCDYTVVYSERAGSLLEPTTATWDLWKNYANDGLQRWCYDGYYRIAPDSYEPTGSNVYFRCVASYLVKSMVALSEGSSCAFDLAVMMLDTVAGCQEESGCFLTMSRSQWLWGDFSIDGGFYDTRWNSDLMLIYLHFDERFGGFTEVIQNYGAFYLANAQDNHFETQNGGWFVCDYSGGTTLTHCSLNHQLAEMEVLYRMADYLQQEELAQLADKMLLAIEDAGTAWIREDGDLHYAVYPNGAYGREDYPYLTYNDLFTMQKTLESRYGARNEILDILMEAKLAWMQENDVTGYLQ